MPAELKAIFFDVGNTLLFPDQSVILKPVHDRGAVPTIQQWHAIERKTKKEFDAQMTRDGRTDHGFWYLFYAHLLEDLAIHDSGVHHALVEATRNSANWSGLRPQTRDILQRLARNYRLAVISNADGKIEALLTRHGIADCFESITDSGLIGCEKPASRIFQEALRTLNASAEHSLYVGDMHSVDYVGATRAGMQAILFDVAGAYGDDGVPRVGSLEELEAKLKSVARVG